VEPVVFWGGFHAYSDSSPRPTAVGGKAGELRGMRQAGVQEGPTLPHCEQIAPGPAAAIREWAPVLKTAACVLALVLLVLGVGKIIGAIQMANLRSREELLHYQQDNPRGEH
jgi:hypothetical protein